MVRSYQIIYNGLSHIFNSINKYNVLNYDIIFKINLHIEMQKCNNLYKNIISTSIINVLFSFETKIKINRI